MKRNLFAAIAALFVVVTCNAFAGTPGQAALDKPDAFFDGRSKNPAMEADAASLGAAPPVSQSKPKVPVTGEASSSTNAASKKGMEYGTTIGPLAGLVVGGIIGGVIGGAGATALATLGWIAAGAGIGLVGGLVLGFLVGALIGGIVDAANS